MAGISLAPERSLAHSAVDFTPDTAQGRPFAHRPPTHRLLRSPRRRRGTSDPPISSESQKAGAAEVPMEEKAPGDEFKELDDFDFRAELGKSSVAPIVAKFRGLPSESQRRTPAHSAHWPLPSLHNDEWFDICMLSTGLSLSCNHEPSKYSDCGAGSVVGWSVRCTATQLPFYGHRERLQCAPWPTEGLNFWWIWKDTKPLGPPDVARYNLGSLKGTAS
ncbi:hypothetical protein B0H11DRAFT_1909864 [Mycena galericulata]|nr:hypothetical protein B0H11DRAFT_1909864 [Mycena galericulata]